MGQTDGLIVKVDLKSPTIMEMPQQLQLFQSHGTGVVTLMWTAFTKSVFGMKGNIIQGDGGSPWMMLCQGCRNKAPKECVCGGG